MDLEYSAHARKKMGERQVTETDVEQALRRQVGDPRPGEPGTIWIRGLAAGGRTLKICVRTSDQRFIVTVAWVD